MKRIISIVVFALIAVTFASPSFAKEEKIPQIISFSSNWSGMNQNGKSAENIAVKQANDWLKKNYKHIKVISHSVSGNSGVTTGGEINFTGTAAFSGHPRNLPVVTGSTGFSSVTILYVEK